MGHKLPHRQVREWFLLLVVLAACLTGTVAGTPTPSQQSLAAAEVVARGFQDPIGVAVSRSGAIVVSDGKAGTVTEIAPDGTRSVLLRRLEAPAGVTFDGDGGLLIVEERGGRVLRRDPSGTLAVLVSGIIRPRWIAAAADGTLYVSARRVRPAGRRSDDEDDDDDRSAGGARILQLLPSGTLRTFAEGFRGLEGLVYSDQMLYAALRRLSTDRGRDGTRVVRFPIRPDGSAGPMELVLRGGRHVPVGIAVDRLGALAATARSGDEDDDDDERGGTVIKQLPTQFVTLATGLRKPRGVAFEAAGHLLVVEGEPARWLRRLRAPAPPTITVPAFTNQSPVTLGGQTAPGHLVHVFPEQQFATPLAAAMADATTGAFTVSVPLAVNAETRRSFTTTAAGGHGFTSAPVSHAIVHDDHQPIVTIVEPAAGVHTHDVVQLRARGEDDGSGVASIAVRWDDALATTIDNPDPTQPLAATTTLDTGSLAEGLRTLTVTATDRAGNAASAAQLVVVDRTPPDTRIVSGPSDETAETTATFVVEGTDLQSPVLDFAWRLDEGAWSPFSPATTIVVNALTPGVHRFEVKARDLAGNEDPTPGVQTFTLTALRIRITDPTDGAVVTTTSVWLRGTVQSGGEVTITIPLPPGMIVPALPASTAGGTFAVEVAIDATTTTLTAIATDVTTGATASHSISVVVQPDSAGPLSGFKALPAAGLAPHVVTFSVNLGEGTRVALDLDSDGTVDFDGTTLEDLPFVYEQPGIYVPTLRATTTDGQILTYRTVVEVYDRAALDARLQAVWNGFTGALQSGDVARAVSFIHGNRRTTWQEYFGQLRPDELAAAGSVFTTIELVQVGLGGAEYEMLREEDGRVFSYPIVFVADGDGRWRLWQF